MKVMVTGGAGYIVGYCVFRENGEKKRNIMFPEREDKI